MTKPQVINPATGTVVKTYTPHSEEEIESILASADHAFRQWKNTPWDRRSSLLRQAARVLNANKEAYARLMTEEMGKLLKDGVAEIEKCALCCEYFADHGSEFLADILIPTEARKSYATFQPLGVVLAIMPWNFPFWQVFRFAAPALMAGNAAVLKHASNTPGSALAIESVFKEAGFPENLFRTLLIPSSRVSVLIRHPVIKAVTLTGSTQAGRSVAGAAGAALKKTVLELGGSDPYIVLEDADLKHAAEICAKSRLINNGQSCIAAKRFIVLNPVKKDFEALMVEAFEKQVMGDPLKPETTVGPLARHDLRDELHSQVERSIAMGAKCLIGGFIPQGPGTFYPPTILTEVKPGMPACEEELFGPVAAIIGAKSEQDAIRIANDTPFGLGSAVFSQDLNRAEKLAREGLEAGSCFVNTFVRSDPRLPFGGVKESGYGRELSSFGIREFVNIKTIVVVETNS